MDETGTRGGVMIDVEWNGTWKAGGNPEQRPGAAKRQAQWAVRGRVGFAMYRHRDIWGVQH